MITPIFWIIPVASILALVFAWFFFRQMMKESEGTELMAKIAGTYAKGYVIPETTIQGCRFGVSRPGGFVLHHGVWIRSTKRMGSDRFPDRRFLLWPCRFLRNEDGYLRIRPYRQCRPVVFE